MYGYMTDGEHCEGTPQAEETSSLTSAGPPAASDARLQATYRCSTSGHVLAFTTARHRASASLGVPCAGADTDSGF